MDCLCPVYLLQPSGRAVAQRQKAVRRGRVHANGPGRGRHGSNSPLECPSVYAGMVAPEQLLACRTQCCRRLNISRTLSIFHAHSASANWSQRCCCCSLSRRRVAQPDLAMPHHWRTLASEGSCRDLGMRFPVLFLEGILLIYDQQYPADLYFVGGKKGT